MLSQWLLFGLCFAATITQVEVVQLVAHKVQPETHTVYVQQVVEVIANNPLVSRETHDMYSGEITSITVLNINSGESVTTKQKDSIVHTTSVISESSATPSLFGADFQDVMLSAHNEKRALHGSQSLHWNSTVYDYAKKYAESYDCSGYLKHSGGSFGENLALGYTPEGAVNAWYNEGKDYQYGTENTYNHFTAVVWNSTNSLGCAYKNCKNAWGYYIVCSYYPAGNIIGYSEQNVFPPKQ